MIEHAPAVYDNQLTRALLGHEVYRLPAGSINRELFVRARTRLRKIDILVLTGPEALPALSIRLGWQVRLLDDKFTRASSRRSAHDCTMEGAERTQATLQNKWDLLLYEEARALYEQV